jgi:Ca2+-transporting ATPase
VPIAGLSMVPVFFADWPLLLLPVQIVFLQLVIDPSCSLVFEAEEAEPDVMRRPPRRGADRLFSRRTVARSALQGLTVLGATLLVFVVSRQGHTPGAARGLTFTALVVAFLTVIAVNRSRTRSSFAMLREPNAALPWVVVGAVVVLAIVLFVPVVRAVFHMDAAPLAEIAVAAAVGVASALWLDLWKLRR